MPFDRSVPYNELPLLPPRVEVETKQTLKAAIAANRALGELKGAGKNIPNQTVLLSVLGLQEAMSSSAIENIVTTNDEVYRAFARDSVSDSDPATKEVLRYNRALWHGHSEVSKGRPVSTRLFEELVQMLKQTEVGVRMLPGTRIANARTKEIIYSPPEGPDRIRDLLENLEEYIYNTPDLDPLIKMAVAHYQFEAIHPFADGNGRTGRIVNILIMVEEGLLELPVLYLSRFIIATKDDYYRLLQEVTERGSWEAWIVYMLRAVEQTAIHTRERISGIRSLIEEVSGVVKAARPKIYSMDLMNVLFEQPYCRIATVMDGCNVTRQTASKYLHELEKIGILRGQKVGRDVYYVNVPFFRLLVE